MTFGILAKEVGIGIIPCIMFSVLVFAGASQFIALSLIQIGGGFGEIVLTTLLVNFRHFLMSASLAPKLDDSIRKIKPLIAFGVVDEIFSLASFKEDGLTKEYLITLQTIGYLSWNLGTILGYVVGGILPTLVKASMGIGLYAMFASILTPQFRKEKKAIILSLSAGIINTICIYVVKLPQGWSIVIAIVLVAGWGSIVYGKEGALDE